MIRIGVVGFGFMGKMHFKCYQAHKDVKIAAICDADEKRLRDTGGIAGNLSGAENAIDLSGIELFSDYGRMLNEVKLDAVSITLPTFLHANFTCQALQAGVHVLCEKPMGLDTGECDHMIAAAKSSGKILQIGHCIRFWPEYVKTKELIDSGQYGKVLAVSMRRLSASPTWTSENWLMNEKRSGGVALDLHIHDTDYVQYLFGTPQAVCSFGAPKASGGLAHIMTQYVYDDNKIVFAEGSWTMQPAFGFEMSFNVVMEGATILYDCTRTPAFKVCEEGKDAATPEVESGDGYSRQIDHFLRRVRGESVPEIVTLESSRNSIRIVEAEVKSIQTQQRVALS